MTGIAFILWLSGIVVTIAVVVAIFQICTSTKKTADQIVVHLPRRNTVEPLRRLESATIGIHVMNMVDTLVQSNAFVGVQPISDNSGR